MKNFGLAGPLAAATMTLALVSTGGAFAQSKFQCAPGETYIMNVMVSAHPYWVPVYEGFKQAAEAMGCETVFSGTPDYDITKQIASFEQDLVKKPAGILLHPMQSDPFIEPINRAIDSGVDVVTFAADSPKSKRTAYITSDNLAEAKFAAEEIVKQVGGSGEYAVLENPGQSNHDLRVTAFIAYMEKNYPNMKLVGRQASNQDSNTAYQATASILQANPNLKRDVDSGGRFGRRRGRGGARGQGQGADHARRRHADDARAHQGGQHPHVAQPEPGHPGLSWASSPHSWRRIRTCSTRSTTTRSRATTRCRMPFIDNGFAVITKDNADSFDLNKYMEGRDPS